MADIEGDVELGEVIVTLVAVGVGIYFLSKAIPSISSAVCKVVNKPNIAGCGQSLKQIFCCATNTKKRITSPAPCLGSGQPLTAQRALAIATQLDLRCSYQLSPDKKQIWFADGSYYDNSTGHVYDGSGADLGPFACFAGFGLPTQPAAGVQGCPCFACGTSATC